MAKPDQPDANHPPTRASYRSGFFFGTLSFFAVSGAGIISTVVTARLYGVVIIGQYALVWAPIAALWVLSSVKEQQALIKEITSLQPRDPRVTQLFAAVFTFSSGLTAVVASLDALVCWFVFHGPLHSPDLITPVFANIAAYAIITNTGWNIDSILSAFVAGRQIFWVRLHEVLSFIIIAVIVGSVWRSVWGMVIALIGSSMTSLAHRIIVVRPFIRVRLTWDEYRRGLKILPDILRFGLKATPGQLAQGISQQGGVWALGTVAPIAVVGAFSRAQTIPQRLQQASNRVTEVLYPTLVGRQATGDGEGFDRALIDSIRYELLGMLLIAAALGGAAHSILNVFGSGFNRAAPALVLLGLFPALASITVTQTQALWATNRPARTSVIAIVRLAVTITLLVVLTPRIGITAPAIALDAGYVVVVVLSGIALRPALSRPLRVTWPVRERLAVIAAYAAGFAATHAVEVLVPSTGGLLLCLPAGAIGYVAVFVGCGGINQRDRKRLADVANASQRPRTRMLRRWLGPAILEEQREHDTDSAQEPSPAQTEPL